MTRFDRPIGQGALAAAAFLIGAYATEGLAQDTAGAPAAPKIAMSAQMSEQTVASQGGMFLFQKTCAACHADKHVEGFKGIEPPPFAVLRQLPPEQIYEALATGKMQQMASKLTDADRRQIAEAVSSRKLGAVDQGGITRMTNRCAERTPLDPEAPQWANSGPNTSGDRFQTAKAAGLTAAQVPRLKVKWAFAAPNAANMNSAPVVGGGRVFFSSDNGYVYALDAKTGCVHWGYFPETATRNAPVYAPIPGKPGAYGVFFGDKHTNVYGVDALTGALLWKTKIDDHPRSSITGSPTIYRGRLFIGVSAGETNQAGDPHYACCTSRGSVTAIDIATGKIAWKTYTIPQRPKPRGVNSMGVTQWGPAGASVWNAPTIDPKRNLVYVGTGNAYTLPAAETSDAMLAMDMTTGKLKWKHQEFKNDAFIAGCGPTSDGKGNCPKVLGPDYDFGGASLILHHLANGHDLLVGASKGGVAVAVDPDRKGRVVWRTKLYTGSPPRTDGLVVFGGAADQRNAYYPLQQPGGGLAIVRLSDGKLLKTVDTMTDNRGQSAAASAIDGVVFTGGWDGIMRAVSTREGKVIWTFNARHDFPTINGAPGHGGSFGSPGPAIAGGMVYMASGYIGVKSGAPGNVMIAFAPE